MMKKLSKKSIDVLCIIILGVMSFLLLYNRAYISSLGGDTGDGAYSVLAGIARTTHDGELPLWNPYMWGGMTGVGNTVSQAFYPVTYLLCKVCYNADAGMLSYSVIYYSNIIHVFILAAGFYILLRVLKCYPVTAFSIASMAAFSGCGFRMKGWLYIYSGLVYIPLFLALVILMMTREGKRGLVCSALAGGVFGLAGLAASTHGILFLILVFAVIYFVYMWSFRQDKKKMLRGTGRCFITGGIGIGVMSVSLLPLIEFLGDSYRSIEGADAIEGTGKMSYESFTCFGLGIDSVRDIIGNYYGWFAVGTALVFFALAGLFCKVKKNKEVYWCGVSLLFIGLLYSCSLYLTNIMYYIPFYNNIREPYLYSFLFVVGAAILGAFGLNSVLKMTRDEKFSYRFYNPAGLFICCAVVLLNVLLPHKCTITSLIILCGVIILFLLHKLPDRKWYLVIASVLLVALAGTEYYKFQSQLEQMGVYTIDDATKSVSGTNLNALRILDADDLPSNTDAYRMIQWTTQSSAYPANIWSVWGYNDASAYMNPMYGSAMNIHTNWSLDKRMQISNIRYLVTTSQEDKSFQNWLQELGLKEVKRVDGVLPDYDAAEGVCDIVYENENRMGNAWLVENCIGYSSDNDISELNDIINGTDFQPFVSALVNTDTSDVPLKEKYGNPKDSDIRMTEYHANSVKFQVNASDEVLMVTAEMMAPGWNVYIDGKKADILEVNTAFRGCVVPQGEHSVEYRYLPQTFIVGCVLGVISIVAIIAICAVSLWRGTKEREDE